MSEDDFYCGDDEEKPLKKDMVECNLCGKEILEMRSNNPLPLVHSDDEEGGRCCTSCNSYVTAARMLLPRNADPFEMADAVDGMVRFIRMANSIRIAEKHMRENLDRLSSMI
tara:strand:- start:832 stop:1167 length:336 start_codon:yes stop_codon:yes gene_type:complete